MNLDAIKQALPEFAKDMRLNLGALLQPENLGDLREDQGLAIAYASALTTQNDELVAGLQALVQTQLSTETIQAIKTAVSLMAMNNVYYRFLHLVSNPEYQSLPARLRMNGMAKPGVDKVDFELYSLAISAINGCGLCMDSHEKTLKKHGVSANTVQNAIRIAAVIKATADTLSLA